MPVPAENDRRRRKRVATEISGRIVYPGVDAECIIRQMSATGALVEVEPLPLLDVPCALDVPGIGVAQGWAIRYVRNLVCIRLDPSLWREQSMSDRLEDPARRIYPPLRDD